MKSRSSALEIPAALRWRNRFFMWIFSGKTWSGLIFWTFRWLIDFYNHGIVKWLFVMQCRQRSRQLSCVASVGLIAILRSMCRRYVIQNAASISLENQQCSQVGRPVPPCVSIWPGYQTKIGQWANGLQCQVSGVSSISTRQSVRLNKRIQRKIEDDGFGIISLVQTTKKIPKSFWIRSVCQFLCLFSRFHDNFDRLILSIGRGSSKTLMRYWHWWKRRSGSQCWPGCISARHW